MAQQEDLLKKLQGFRDPRSTVGAMARGKNMYPGGNAAQQGGGTQNGRPQEMAAKEAAMQRNAEQSNLQRQQPATVVNANPVAERAQAMQMAARRRLMLQKQSMDQKRGQARGLRRGF